MKRRVRICSVYLLLLFLLAPARAETVEITPVVPKFKIAETIASYRGTGTMDYLAFPAIVASGENEIMLSYKRGTDHGWDPGSQLEIVRFDLETGTAIQDPIQIGIPNVVEFTKTGPLEKLVWAPIKAPASRPDPFGRDYENCAT